MANRRVPLVLGHGGGVNNSAAVHIDAAVRPGGYHRGVRIAECPLGVLNDDFRGGSRYDLISADAVNQCRKGKGGGGGERRAGRGDLRERDRVAGDAVVDSARGSSRVERNAAAVA